MEQFSGEDARQTARDAERARGTPEAARGVRRRGLGRTLLLGVMVFLLLMGLTVGADSYLSVKRALYTACFRGAEVSFQVLAACLGGDGVSEIDGKERDVILRMLHGFDPTGFLVLVPDGDGFVSLYHENGRAEENLSAEEAARCREILQTGRKWTPREEIDWQNARDGLTLNIPIFDAQGNAAALLHVHLDGARVTAEIDAVTIQAAALLLASLLVLVAGCVFFVRRAVFLPFTRLTVFVREYVARRRDHRADELDPALLRRGDEIGDLARAFRAMDGELTRYLAEMRAAAEEKQALRTELDVARRIQMMLLPDGGKARLPGCALSASIRPALTVGGDFYDFYALDGGRVCVTIADVSGKGVPAALFMVQAKQALKNAVLARAARPSEGWLGRAVAEANRVLAEGNELCMFVTAFVAVLSPSDGALVYVNAGHNPPYLGAGGSFAPLPAADNCPLGLLPDEAFAERRAALTPGETLFLYTDGVTEAENEAGALYGDARLRQALHAAPRAAAPDVLLRRIDADVRAFVGARPPSDDMTMLAAAREAKDAG